MTEKTFAFKSGGYGLIPALRGLFNCERNFGNYSLVPPFSALACVLGIVLSRNSKLGWREL